MSLLGSVFGLGGMVLGGLIGSIIPGIGTAIGMSVGAAIGGALGGYVGNILFPDKINYGDQPPPKPYENRIQIATYGAAIPITYESIRLAGNIIYMQPIQQTIIHSRHRQDGIRYHQYERIYTSTFAVAFCEGPIEGFRRIWINNDCWIDWSDSTSESYTISEERGDQITIYLGTQAQTADADISAILGAAETPAYKGIAYIVFPNFPLGEYGGMPKIEVEIGPKDSLCSEYFTGSNGDPLSSSIIEDTEYYSGGATVSIYENALRHEAVAGIPDGYQYQYQTTFSFLGEFDFVLDYNLVGVTDENSGWIYFTPLQGGAASSITFGVEWWFGGGGNVNYYAFGDSGEMDYVETSQLSGKLRITRDSSNDIRVFYWNESLSRWEANGDTSGFIVDNFSESFTPVFEVFSGFDDVTIDINDFITISGCDNIE